jgi:hypothetical protein
MTACAMWASIPLFHRFPLLHLYLFAAGIFRHSLTAAMLILIRVRFHEKWRGFQIRGA